MPRGLGEDPLSRKRKGSRRTVHRSESAPGHVMVTPFSDPHAGVTGGYTGPRSFSHNDVFFVKRSASDSLPGPRDQSPATAEPVSAPPEVAVQPVPAPAVQDVPAQAPAETQATEIPATEPVADTIPEVAAPEPPAVVATIEPPPQRREAPASEPVHAEISPANPGQEGGLLKRLLGRFHRQ